MSGQLQHTLTELGLIYEAHDRGLLIGDNDLAALNTSYELEAQRRGLTMRRHDTFKDFIAVANPTLWQFEHIPWVSQAVDQVVRGQIQNLLVFAPPRYLKSEVFSRLMIPYFLDVHERATAAVISHSDGLALELSEAARDRYEEFVGTVRPGTEAKRRWETMNGGQVWASGVGGRFLGQGFHLGVIDDPVDVEQALSLAHQRRFIRFWPQRFLNRREPGARVVVVMQRLGAEDPIDYLLRREVGERVERAPMHWHVLCLDEIKSDEPLGRWDGPRGLPSTCQLVDVDPRKPGEVLAPTRFSAKEVEAMRVAAGPYTTATQRQQRPLQPTGDFWQSKWFADRVYDELPSGAYNGGKDWDTAYSAAEANSASAWVESYRGVGLDEEFPIYIHNIGWDWLEFPQLIELMGNMPGPHYVEQKASGKSAVQTLAAYNIRAEEVPVKGDKLARASAVQPVVAQGRVFVRREVMEKLLWGEQQGLLRITAEALQAGDEGLDVNDVFVQALTRHLGIHAPKKRRVRFG